MFGSTRAEQVGQKKQCSAEWERGCLTEGRNRKNRLDRNQGGGRGETTAGVPVGDPASIRAGKDPGSFKTKKDREGLGG